MTTLVLHPGAEYADEGSVQRALAAGRDQLADAGVLVPRGETSVQWRDTAQGLLRSGESVAASAWLQEAVRSGVRVVVVSSDVLTDALTSPEQAAALAGLAASTGVEARVVVVVREQIGYINSLYCRRVLSLDTARTFAEFATDPVPAHRFDYVASFGALADTEGLDLAAIPYPELLRSGACSAILEAVGHSDGAPAPRASDDGPAALPGPVLVGATRLLHKRLRRLGMFHEHGKPRLRTLVDRLAQRAVDGAWDTATFWGWDTALRRTVEQEYAASNDMFAQFVWGTRWQEPYSTGSPQRSDFADLEPTVLHDVMTTVDRLVSALAKGSLDPA